MLPARHVIHAVGPVWRGGHAGEAEQLASAYRRSLELAAENGCRQIAFPSLSTGAYGYPIDQASRVALATAQSFLQIDRRDRARSVRALRGRSVRRVCRGVGRDEPRLAARRSILFALGCHVHGRRGHASARRAWPHNRRPWHPANVVHQRKARRYPTAHPGPVVFKGAFAMLAFAARRGKAATEISVRSLPVRRPRPSKIC